MAFLFYLFILGTPTGILLIAWWGKGNKIFRKIIGYFWIWMFGLFLLGSVIGMLTDKKELEKIDYYGEYIIDRNYFPGKQADWQYDNFRFEIKENDSIFFHVTDKNKILKTYRGTVTTTKSFSSERLIIKMEQPTHHIMTNNPTTYRSDWSFYLVFYSPKFNNMYFKKGQWIPLDK